MQHTGQLRIGFDGTQAVLQYQQQQRQGQKQQRSADAVQDGNNARQWQFDLAQRKVFGAFSVHCIFPQIDAVILHALRGNRILAQLQKYVSFPQRQKNKTAWRSFGRMSIQRSTWIPICAAHIWNGGVFAIHLYDSQQAPSDITYA